jgi:hypothetical protein
MRFIITQIQPDIRGSPSILSILALPLARAMAPIWNMACQRTTKTPIEVGKWVFLVGEAEPYISSSDLTTGCIEWKQSVEATRVLEDKYGRYGVQPQAGSGAITIGGTQETAFKGSIAHVAIWNRLLSAPEIASIWAEGKTELRNTPMYHSYT